MAEVNCDRRYGQVVIDLNSIDGLITKAFELACFIQRDRDAARHIVARSLARLEVVANTQGKRLYYKPTGRAWSLRSSREGVRNKVSFSETHLLQRLIYIESEPFEMAQENAQGGNVAAEEDLVIHFVKHLVRKAGKRNSFYVTLGLGRLLHNYTTAETMDIYNAVIQDAERVKDDYYFRSRKGVLMQELKERFGDLIKVCYGPRGEERFEADENPRRFVELVRECLSFFTPWNTPCLVPAGIDPIRDGIPSLSFRGRTEEDETEVNRIHAVLHPDCFKRLISDLRFASPEERLAVPRFFYTNESNGNGAISGRSQTAVNEEEISSIKRELEKNAANRKSAHARVLRVVVDGNECARLYLSQTRTTCFQLSENAELIEVFARQKVGHEPLLAAYPLTYDETEGIQPANSSITLEGGQKISISVSPGSDGSGAMVEISYRETNPLHAASLLFHQLRGSIRTSSRPAWAQPGIVMAVVALIVFAIGLIAVIRHDRDETRPTGRPDQIAATQQLEPVPENPTARENTQASQTSSGANTLPGQPAKSPSRGATASRNSADRDAAPVNQSETATGPGTETRTTVAPFSNVTLSAVRKIYVEIVGGSNSQQLREAIDHRFRSTAQITLVDNKNDADALLQLSIARGTDTNSTVVVELINRRGTVIWSGANTGGYTGSSAEISSNVVKDLLAAMRRSKRQQ